MAIQYFNQELWSSLLLKGTSEKLAFQEVVKNVGTVNGKQVHFSGIGNVTITSYTKDTNITNQTLTDTGIDLDLDQQKYFSVNVDDIDRAQTSADIMAEITRKGSEGLKKAIDTHIAGLHAGAGITSGLGTGTTPIEINSANVNTYLLKIARLLKEANADPASLWCVVPVWMWEKMILKNQTLISNNADLVASGYIGTLYGLKLYVSNSIANTTGAKWKILAGDGDAMRIGMNVDKIETLRNNAQFGDIVRGLIV